MAAQQLTPDVEPRGLAGKLLEEYEAWKAYRGAGAPDKLLYTFAASSGTGVPSHDAGKAIDIVTDGYVSRPYLIEFGIWLFCKRPELSVYFYGTKYEPHVHVGEVSGFGKGSYLAVNKGLKGKFDIYPRSQVSGKAAEIIKLIQNVRKTYPAGVETDWPVYEEMLQGKMPSGSGNWKEYLRKYWWVGLISVGLLLILFVVKKWRDGQGEETDGIT